MMTTSPVDSNLTAEPDPFDLIWTQRPQPQNRHSSSWWFFLLFPRQEHGFGPKQIMFALVSRVGKTVSINRTPHPGLQLLRLSQNGSDEFNSFAVGWIHDGQQMHEHIVHRPVAASLKPGSIRAWAEQDNGRQYGGEIKTIVDKPLGLEVHFIGEKGCGRFHTWGDPEFETTAPHHFDTRTLGLGANVIAWTHLRFAGEFASPSGTEWLEGIGYFQRVCLNFPPFPWKWIWATFEDESVFSAFVPYIGPHLLRRGDRLFPHAVERAAADIKPGSYFMRGGTWDRVDFDQTDVSILPGNGRFPRFAVTCRANTGDFIEYEVAPYDHAQFLLDRPLVGGLWQSRFNYNEYLFRMQNLSGRVMGQPLQQKIGYGNLEYTWGLGL